MVMLCSIILISAPFLLLADDPINSLLKQMHGEYTNYVFPSKPNYHTVDGVQNRVIYNQISEPAPYSMYLQNERLLVSI